MRTLIILWAIAAGMLTALSWSQMKRDVEAQKEMHKVQEWFKVQCVPEQGEEVHAKYEKDGYLSCMKSPVKAWGIVK